ncbi:hypothetical protein [Vogesella sp. LIG4]|uniref:hypothetical protein n=1 Tax=Vogesella sp. LIG4 TaxID=1192162 RepID=UPI00081F8FAE|nr:hypothetical protein [Vogesella sp. LIG4]SCK14474.1 hypothetical protein PSELUDRAFT_1399 [Vogesella sp. LIG4]
MPQVIQLQDLTPKQASGRIWYFFFTPFWVSLLLTLASLALDNYWSRVIVEAVSGQLALPLIKLFLYVAGWMLGTAAFLAGVPLIAKFLCWSGERVASVAFDYSSAANGVILGFLPAAIIQDGARAFAVTIYVSLVILALQACLWASSYLAFGKADKHFNNYRWLTRLFGLALVAIFVWAFHGELWSELKGKCSQSQQSRTTQSTGPAKASR